MGCSDPECEAVNCPVGATAPGDPMQITLTDREGVTYRLDGRRNTPDPDLTGMDEVSKVVLRMLLQDALRQISPTPPHHFGGIVQPGPITITNQTTQ